MSQLKIYLLVKFWTLWNPTLAAMAYFSCFEGVLGIKQLFFSKFTPSTVVKFGCIG